MNKDLLLNKVERHEQLCTMLHEIYAKKNHDYGDSFGQSYKEWGITAAMTRMSDKWNRLKTLSKLPEEERQVADEKITDSLIDLANYALMTYMEVVDEERERASQ